MAAPRGVLMCPRHMGRRRRADGTSWCVVARPVAVLPRRRAVRTQRWKYIRRYDDRPITTMPNIDDGASKQYLMRHGLAQHPVHPEALYDLIYDPNEAANLVSNPAYADVLADMRARLDAWMQRTDDPLLRGPVAEPGHPFADHPDAPHPAGVDAAIKPAWFTREKLDIRP